MSQPLAFVIDDDKNLGEAYRQALELSGFTAKHLIDSSRALPIIIEEQPNVIMLDMQMPKMNGEQVLKAIRDNEKTAHIKVIIATANLLNVNNNIDEMADLVLQKPVSMSQIMMFAQRMLKKQDSTKPT